MENSWKKLVSNNNKITELISNFIEQANWADKPDKLWNSFTDDADNRTIRNKQQQFKQLFLSSTSLTTKLQNIAADSFDFAVLTHRITEQVPSEFEAEQLNLATNSRILVREIIISCFAEPWLLARTIAPIVSNDKQCYISENLVRLADKPLGSWIFNRSTVKRSPFKYVKYSGATELPLIFKPLIMGRCSVFSSQIYGLLLTELFLPSMLGFFDII